MGDYPGRLEKWAVRSADRSGEARNQEELDLQYGQDNDGPNGNQMIAENRENPQSYPVSFGRHQNTGTKRRNYAHGKKGLQRGAYADDAVPVKQS